MFDKKGSGQPIWVLVSILLAVIVAVTMFQIMQKGNAKDIDSIMKGANRDVDTAALITACKQWKDSSWTIKPKGEGELTMEAYALRLDLLSKDEYMADKKLGICDCVVFMKIHNALSLGEAMTLFRTYIDCNPAFNKIGCEKNLCGDGEGSADCKNAHKCS